MSNLSLSTKQIRIAGAGPSGLSAAILLAKKGHEVEVHESKHEVASRWKRGLQIIENFSAESDILENFQQAGLSINFDAQPVYGVTLLDGRRQRSSFKSQTPLGYYVKRGSFEGALDRGLLDQARDAGVRVVFNSHQRSDDDVQIVATGPTRVDGLGKEVTFNTPLSDRMTVILDPKLAPGGYAYLFVVKGLATLGMAILSEYRKVDHYYQKTVERFKQIDDIEIHGGETSYSYANFFTQKTLEDSGKLFIGEAGGFQDYLFGFGIRMAIESGILASKSLSEDISYDELWKKSLQPKQEISLWNRFLYEKGRHWLPSVFIALAKTNPSFRSYMRGWYQGNPLQRLTLGWIKRSWKNRNLS
jgi:flavin-dependent dehydrogenase